MLLVRVALLMLGLRSPCVDAQVAPFSDGPVAASAQAAVDPALTSSGYDVKAITGWSLNDELDSNPHHEPEITLEPGHPNLIVFFDTRVAQQRRYRLLSFDTDWTLTTGHLAHYRHLPPGHYTFEVQTEVPGRGWVADPMKLRVTQRPFFYQTWYADLIVLLVVVAVAGQLLTQRDQLLKGQVAMVLEERNRIASDCHDTLMAGFAAISWQLEATARLFREQGGVEDRAAQSCELARSMVAHCQAEARRIIWDLRDSTEVTDRLSEALTRTVGAHRLHGKVQTTFDIEGEEIPISPGAVHHLVCIGQEAVSNALRHADSTSIRVGLHYEDERLRLSVRDDGRGFDLSDHAVRSGHFGILVMEERARKLGGDFSIFTSADKGTEVTVTVAFQSIHRPAHQQHFVVPWIGV